MKGPAMDKFLSFIRQLRTYSLSYSLHDSIGSFGREAIMVTVNVPGNRYEVEFFEDGHVEVERFTSSGDIYGEEELVEILSFGEPPPRTEEH
jgi:hypothetical protein